VRPAQASDAEAIAAIHNQGISERVATFETNEKRAEDVRSLIEDGALVLVFERDGDVAGFAKVGPYDDGSHYYAGIGEATLYVERSSRRGGVGLALLQALCDAAEERGRHKLVAKVFASNEPSLALFERCGFRRVGVHERHASLDGEWKDVVMMERSLGVHT
jgi:phosphinothricin acetyltransferase